LLNQYSGGLPEDPDSAQTAYLELCKALTASDPGMPADKRIELLYLMSEYCLDHSEVDEAGEYVDLMLPLLQQADDCPQEYKIHLLQGRVLQQKKQWDAALEAYEKALGAASDKTHPGDLAEIHKHMGKLYFEQGKIKLALGHFQQMTELAERAGKTLQTGKAYEYAGLAYLRDDQLDPALKLLNKARELYLQENHLLHINNLDNYIGMVHFWKGNYSQALDIYNSTLDRLEKTDLTYANILVQIGTLYQNLGDYAKSLQYLLESAQLRQEFHNGFGLASNYLCLGVSYFTINDCKKAGKYYKLAYDLYSEQGALDGMLKAQVNLGILAKQRHDFQKALDQFLPALKAAQASDNHYLHSNIIINIADIYFQQRDYAKALELNQKALEIKQKLGQKGDIVKLYLAMAEQYLGLQDIPAAEQHALLCLDLARELDMKAAMVSGYQVLSQLEENRRNFKQALAYYKHYMDLHKTLVNESTQRNISEIKIKYDTQAKEREAELLRQQARELELKNQEIEQQKANLQETLD